ncbi:MULTISPECIES: nitrate reductase molybdenum cofactor assembly chaperone [Idiomarina]|jgi:nitrate reductase delta subunit|uniref:Nitrate reductase molybdenum cofactor assembly chaperone n=1 Tax=Idiomarina abyssalis TaxID=86102 RepID=A0A8I1KEY1_9GAMM|nr:MULTISPECIES: nitrate reductase molybdenum cofactor assembly chaperone [Idiomarina]MAO68879.1 nitrate reductase molybdenum cofactor assembly chaperone [Idiomarina sp.]MBF81073.1 nitrate reductase molybdenum cofactor assembly chaperone [Idiomarina sp.]MBJ7266272.1 nitrate reductase molybdenum cofactor assembly chaperone [Idiomarina abyssalis]MBJ7272671.1 nitrate reductase molybdenum cofactor assembly chaperone [Idiomarina abyssalis]MBJ7316411.1 nitrate reductase molybdenum cofactor assembly |tara:strand:- start:8329 stop:9057 length:729 start_codon:yes stop_codon:yes gene_type:complete
MQVLQVISLLLDYPKPELVEARAELEQMIQQSPLSADDKAALEAFIEHRTSMSLMDWQSEYDGLFERGRALSLLLFEHVHGESRDRGQAMVDLMNQYKTAGLDLGVKELPDYIPLYLEFLSTQGDENARLGLEEVAHILALLTARLEQRGSNYSLLFQTLLSISGVQIDLDDVRQQIANEKRDDTSKELDKVWEEEAVTFAGNDQMQGCPTAQNRPSEGQRRDQYVPLNTDDLSQPRKVSGI